MALEAGSAGAGDMIYSRSLTLREAVLPRGRPGQLVPVCLSSAEELQKLREARELQVCKHHYMDMLRSIDAGGLPAWFLSEAQKLSASAFPEDRIRPTKEPLTHFLAVAETPLALRLEAPRGRNFEIQALQPTMIRHNAPKARCYANKKASLNKSSLT